MSSCLYLEKDLQRKGKIPLRLAAVLVVSLVWCNQSPIQVTKCSAKTGALTGAPSEPHVFFVDVEVGPARGGPNNVGVPISIFGKGFGTNRGDSRVTIGGVEVANYLVWGATNAHNSTLDMIVVQPGPTSKGGPIVVTVNGKVSNTDHSFVVNSGNVYFVAPNGSDAKSCSISMPCATISSVVSKMKPGDTVLLRAGDYTERETWIRAPQGGLQGNPKTIKNYPGEQVYLTNAERGFFVDADYITVSGLNFRNGKFLGAVGWASRDQRGDRFIDNTFAGTIGWAAIEVGGHEHLLAGNVCDISGSTVGTMGHCYYVAAGTNTNILHNVAIGAPGYGLHIYDERRETNDFQRVIRNVLVEGNILRNSRQRSGMIVAMVDQGGYGNHIENITIRNNLFVANNHAGLVLQGIAQEIKVYNNTFYQNGRLSILVGGDAKLTDVRNNLFYQSRNSNCSSNCSWFPEAHVAVGPAFPDITLLNNSYHPSSAMIIGARDPRAITGDVRFANASALDFHVDASSVDSGHGETLTTVSADFDGRLRPHDAKYDIGAFQH
jgi:hypothetical protein